MAAMSKIQRLSSLFLGERINNISMYGLVMRVVSLLTACSSCAVTTWFLTSIIIDNPVWISVAVCASGMGGLMLAALCWVAGENAERTG